MFNPALVKILGVVTSSGDDWSLGQVVWIFSVAIVSLGLAAAYAGKWLEEVGPRMVGFVAACCWGEVLLLALWEFIYMKLVCKFHFLFQCSVRNLLFLGLGCIYYIWDMVFWEELVLGLVMFPLFQHLIRWFPDRRGMATGMAIMGFGGGAMIAKVSIDRLLAKFYKAPEYLGSLDSVQLVTEGGRRFVDIAGNFN